MVSIFFGAGMPGGDFYVDDYVVGDSGESQNAATSFDGIAVLERGMLYYSNICIGENSVAAF